MSTLIHKSKWASKVNLIMSVQCQTDPQPYVSPDGERGSGGPSRQLRVTPAPTAHPDLSTAVKGPSSKRKKTLKG